MTLSPAAVIVAERHASEDRDLLARLRREGAVQKGDGPRGMARETASLQRDVEARAFPPRNLAIRPKKRRKR